MYTRRFFLPPICFYEVEDFLGKVVLPLHEVGSLTVLRMLLQRGHACLLVGVGGKTALVRCTPGEVSISSTSKQVLRSLYKLLLKRLSETCWRDRVPELLLVYVGDSAIPDAESKVAAILSRGLARSVVFSVLFVTLYWALVGAAKVDFTVGTLLSLATTFFTAITLPPYLILRAIPRWKVTRERGVRVYRVLIERLDGDVITAALLAKTALSKHPGRYLHPSDIKKVLEEWGVPVRGVTILELDFSGLLGGSEKVELYITSVPEISALSLSFIHGYPSIILNAELLADLEPHELSAVLAHELEHLKHGDALFLPLALLLGLMPLAFIGPLLVKHALLLAVYLAVLVTFLTLLCRAVEVRADLGAAAEKGVEPLKRAIVKLEYPELLRSTSLRSRIVSLAKPSLRPPAWLRIVALEKYSGRSSLIEALLINILAPRLAAAFEHTGCSKSCKKLCRRLLRSDARTCECGMAGIPE